MSRIAVLSLSSGILFVLAVLIGVAILAPRSAGAAVVGGSLVACPLAEIQLDQGYGLTRTALRPVCTNQSTYASPENSTVK